MRTIVYIDGFNLYYRMLRYNPKLKWLDVTKLSQRLLDKNNSIIRVNYYTAIVSQINGRSQAKDKQKCYIAALKTDSLVHIHYGNFESHPKYATLCPLSQLDGHYLFKPNLPDINLTPYPDVVRVIKTEEKGSDVNLASHLVRDACLDKFDVAAVITNDTDLFEPIKIAVKSLNKIVGILSPVSTPASKLSSAASFVKRISESDLKASQFPDILKKANGTTITRPSDWC